MLKQTLMTDTKNNLLRKKIGCFEVKKLFFVSGFFDAKVVGHRLTVWMLK